MHFSGLPKAITSLDTVSVALNEALKVFQDTTSNLSSVSGRVGEILKEQSEECNYKKSWI